MPSFADSFWSSDYAAGLGVVFDQLDKGCNENDEVLALVNARMEAEEAYGNRLKEIPTQFGEAKKSGGFFASKNGSQDEGASLKKAYEGVLHEMGEEGKAHLTIASNMRDMVHSPFSKWADEHRQRVQYSYKVLRSKVKSYDKEHGEVQRAQKRYFNKCRLYEELKESSGETVTPATSASPASIDRQRSASTASDATTIVNKPSGGMHSRSESITVTDPSRELSDFGGQVFSSAELGNLMKKALQDIKRSDLKVAILGTYENVSSGDQIVSWIQANVPIPSDSSPVAFAERFGQDLVTQGYLRLVGQVGSKFANSSAFSYQWRKKAFIVAGLQDDDDSLEATVDKVRPFVGEYLGETLSSYVSSRGAPTDESPIQRALREVSELDARYKVQVARLDDVRCTLEESVIDHLKFMERCESDRLKAVKAVFLDFLAAASNSLPALQSSVERLLLFQEAIHPAADLRYLVESYRTGPFTPKVTVYDNYYNSSDSQTTFGLDLELRCRGDRRKVPSIVSTVLNHMDDQYPLLDNDEVRLNVWTVSVSLKTTHALRKELNTGKAVDKAILQKYELPVAASILKLYLLELPDSLVPHQYYDVVKRLYSAGPGGQPPSSEERIQSLQNTFAQLLVSNIATLDAITTHLARLIRLTNAGDEYILQLSQELSHCFLRPRVESPVTFGDRHAYRLVSDLLVYRDQIFPELKRKNSAFRSSNSISKKSIKSESRESSRGAIPPHATDTPVRRQSLKNRLEAITKSEREAKESAAAAASNSASPESPGKDIPPPLPEKRPSKDKGAEEGGAPPVPKKDGKDGKGGKGPKGKAGKVYDQDNNTGSFSSVSSSAMFNVQLEDGKESIIIDD
ncbi:Rho-GTPase-activating protein 8 [Yarrowia sp. C11]|nr:Rho-GTPase-activating protein 8 [Yarrowia sp. C11]